jgi:2-aminoethylphosphonate-pyruvate transaminase
LLFGLGAGFKRAFGRPRLAALYTQLCKNCGKLLPQLPPLPKRAKLRHMRLLNPGPVTLSKKVREAMQKPDLCHREPDFANLAKQVIEKLKLVYPEAKTSHRPVFLTGSGSSAVEMMLTSLCPKPKHADPKQNKKTLVIANGVYGERACTMLEIQGKEFIQQKTDWQQEPDWNETEKLLTQHPEISHVFVVHHETTTGRLNQLDALGKICIQHNKKLLIDAVSSFGAEEIKFAPWNVQALAATANKCLHGVPGISFALVAEETIAAVNTLQTEKSNASALYLDLFRYAKDQEKGFSPFTQSVQCMYALDAALDEFHAEGGWQKRREQYRQYQNQIVQTLNEIGVKTLLPNPKDTSCVLVSFTIPANSSYQALHDALFKADFTIYAGQAKFGGEIFRISTMGALTQNDIDELCQQLKANLKKPA